VSKKLTFPDLQLWVLDLHHINLLLFLYMLSVTGIVINILECYFACLALTVNAQSRSIPRVPASYLLHALTATADAGHKQMYCNVAVPSSV